MCIAFMGDVSVSRHARASLDCPHVHDDGTHMHPSRKPTSHCSLLLSLAAHHPTPLLHHVSVQHVSSRHISSQDGIYYPFYSPSVVRLSRSSRCNPQQPAFTCDSQRIEDEKCIVSQPLKRVGDSYGRELVTEETVANDLGDRPRYKHGTVSWRCGDSVWERVCDAPDEQKARCDLHCSSEERSANHSCTAGLASCG